MTDTSFQRKSFEILLAWNNVTFLLSRMKEYYFLINDNIRRLFAGVRNRFVYCVLVTGKKKAA